MRPGGDQGFLQKLMTGLERDYLRRDAEAYTDSIARHQDEREASMRASLASAATFIALMAAGSTGGAVERPTQLRAGQFLLSLLFAAVLAYYASAIYQRSRDIADEGVRRLLLELEFPDVVQEKERLAYSLGSRRWRQTSGLPLAVLAALPRWGKSLQHGLLLVALCAVLPGAWFSLSQPRTLAMDATVIVATFVALLLCSRVAVAGCRHWFWVHARDLTLRASPHEHRAPAWTWWIHAAREPGGPPGPNVTENPDRSRRAEASRRGSTFQEGP